MSAPAFKIIADGLDVTAHFNDRLTDLVVTDYDGMQADEFKAVIDDRDWIVQPPRKGALVEIWMCDDIARAATWARMGQFKVNRRRRHFDKGKGRVMEVSGKSADLRKAAKQPRTGSYPAGTTYQSLADQVAGRYGLSAKVSPSLAGLVVGWLDQGEESDLHLMTRLARDHDAINKWNNGQLMVLARADLDMAPLILLPTDFIECHVEDDDRTQHAKATAHTHNRGESRRDPETVDNDEGAGDGPEFQLRHTYPNRELARSAAKGRMARLQRDEKRLHGKLTGSTRYMAGLPASIAWGVDLYDGDYTLKKAVHHMVKGGGYTTEIDTGKGKAGKGGKSGG